MAGERFLMCNVKGMTALCKPFCPDPELTSRCTGKGIVMFTGCSHRGVVNASRNAVYLLGGTVPLHAVLGGYHLAGSPQCQVEETVQDLKALNTEVCLPVHCSGWRVKYEIEKRNARQAGPLWCEQQDFLYRIAFGCTDCLSTKEGCGHPSIGVEFAEANITIFLSEIGSHYYSYPDLFPEHFHCYLYQGENGNRHHV